jgi:poly(A) polymerase
MFLGRLVQGTFMTLDNLLNFYDSSAIFSILKDGGGNPRFVGGCVRNTLVGIPINDVDIATTLLPDEVESILKKSDIQTLDAGKKHGTIIALLEGRSYEITTLRKDIETDGRHAVVSFSDSWEEDAQRRDFTINAMSYDPYTKELHDYYGGEKDLKDCVVRFVGDPYKRVKEDYLRILRFFRFYAIYGRNSKIDHESLKACKENAEKIKILSAERKREEFSKILMADDSSSVLDEMWDAGVLSSLFEYSLSKGFSDHMNGLKNVYSRVNENPPILLKIFLIADASNLELDSLERIFHFSRKHHRYFKSVKNILNRGLKYIEGNIYSLIYEDADTVLDCVYYISARDGVEYTSLLKEIRSYMDIDLIIPITGKDVMDLFGITPGTAVGDLLKEAERFWCESKFTATRERVLDFLKDSIK